MKPVYCKGPSGRTFLRVKDAFVCLADGTLAKGRAKVKAI